ncbi:MAG: hypothetical protein U0361_04980 [Nitrospiraceae bacterium]
MARMGNVDELDTFYPKFGDRLKQQFSGWTAFILTADMKLPGKLLGARTANSVVQRRHRMPSL